MTDVHHVPEERRAELMDIAKAAKSELIRAGLSAAILPAERPVPGASIAISTVDDGGAGVYVSWRLSSEITALVQDRLLAQDLSHPAVALAGRVRAAMRLAIYEILSASGMSAEIAPDDMDPLRVYLH